MVNNRVWAQRKITDIPYLIGILPCPIPLQNSGSTVACIRHTFIVRRILSSNMAYPLSILSVIKCSDDVTIVLTGANVKEKVIVHDDILISSRGIIPV